MQHHTQLIILILKDISPNSHLQQIFRLNSHHPIIKTLSLALWGKSYPETKSEQRGDFTDKTVEGRLVPESEVTLLPVWLTKQVEHQIGMKKRKDLWQNWDTLKNLSCNTHWHVLIKRGGHKAALYSKGSLGLRCVSIDWITVLLFVPGLLRMCHRGRAMASVSILKKKNTKGARAIFRSSFAKFLRPLYTVTGA